MIEHLWKWRSNIEGTWTAHDAAREFVAFMDREHPDEIARWIDDRIVQIVAGELTALDRRDRQDQIALAFAGADPEALAPFMLTFAVDPAHRRVALGDMTAVDLDYVASRYERDAKHKAAMAAFLRALAARVGDGVVSDYIEEAEAARLLASFAPDLAAR